MRAARVARSCRFDQDDPRLGIRYCGLFGLPVPMASPMLSVKRKHHAMNRGRSCAMRRGLLALTAIATALALSPATSGAGEMKDSWVTTKAKMAMVKDDRVKARRFKVETRDG